MCEKESFNRTDAPYVAEYYIDDQGLGIESLVMDEDAQTHTQC